MENTLLELAKQIPALLVLVYLVIQFTKTIKEVVQAFREELQDFKTEMRRTNGVIERNTEVLSHVKAVLASKKEKHVED